ncbi:MAG: mechanosensitive ion channel family protein [Nitrososphaerales archaeon]
MGLFPIPGINDLSSGLLISAFIIAAAWSISQLISRRQDETVRKEEVKRFLVVKLESYGTHLAAFVIVIFILDLPGLWIQVQATNEFIAQLIQVAILWAISIFIARNMNEIYTKVIEKIRVVPHDVSVLAHRFLTYGIYAIAAVLTLGIFGLTGAVQGLLVGAGFAGIVVGFAAQDTLGNLFSGIALMMDRPFKIGDWIHLKGQNLVGFVKSTSFRSVTIVGPDNTPINIPNSTITRESIVNYSAHRLRRFFLSVGIAYESDVSKAIKIITETLSQDPALAKQGIKGQGYYAPIEVVVDKFADSSVDLQAKVFIDTTLEGGLFLTKSRMLAEIKASLVEGGVEIPYPRRVVITQNEE